MIVIKYPYFGGYIPQGKLEEANLSSNANYIYNPFLHENGQNYLHYIW